MQQLFESLNSIHPLSPELEQELRKALKFKEVSRGKHWLKEGEICKSLVFIEEGLLKLYFEKGEKEATIAFYKEFSFVLSAQSYFGQTPSKFAIKGLESCRLWTIEQPELNRLLSRHPGFMFNMAGIIESICIGYEEHVGVMYMPAMEKYLAVLKLYPWMTGRITDKEIASYLGVTPTCLCRIRRQKYKTGR